MISLRSFVPALAFLAMLASTSVSASSYALCIHETPAQISARTDPQAGPAYWGAFATFADQLKSAGVMRGGSAFDTASPAKAIRSDQAADAAKHLPASATTYGGYFIIEVATEADALAWAARVPNPRGHVEVRALLPMTDKSAHLQSTATMHYAVIVYETEADFAARSDPATAPAYMGAYFTYSQVLEKAGVAVGGAGLLPPPTATTVRVRGGKRLVQDGPFAETKEQLGGFFLIDVPDLDAALHWAALCPAAALAGVEVRPMLPPPPVMTA